MERLGVPPVVSMSATPLCECIAAAAAGDAPPMPPPESEPVSSRSRERPAMAGLPPAAPKTEAAAAVTGPTLPAEPDLAWPAATQTERRRVSSERKMAIVLLRAVHARARKMNLEFSKHRAYQ